MTACACADPCCDDSRAAFDEEERGYPEPQGTCACGGTLKAVGELNTLAEVVTFLRCTKCQRASERQDPVQS